MLKLGEFYNMGNGAYYYGYERTGKYVSYLHIVLREKQYLVGNTAEEVYFQQYFNINDEHIVRSKSRVLKLKRIVIKELFNIHSRLD